MEQVKIDMFMSVHKKKFPKDKIGIILSHLEQFPDKNFLSIQTANYESPIKFFIISFFLGLFGIDRFMLEQEVLGVFKLLTLGGFGIWWLIDLVFMIRVIRKKNFKIFKIYANY